MSFIDRFAAIFRRLDREDTSQTSREALVDLLVWTMFVDHHLALDEHRKLDELTRDLPWESVTSLSDFFRDSIARTRDVLDEDKAAIAYLYGIGKRLGDLEARRSALVACEQMMTADGKLTEEEVDHLKAVSKAFGLR